MTLQFGLNIFKEEQGFITYRRPLYLIIGDGFLYIGNVITITYPFSGHEVTAT